METLTRTESIKVQKEIKKHLENKISMFKSKLDVTPKYCYLHRSIEKIIQADVAKLNDLKFWARE